MSRGCRPASPILVYDSCSSTMDQLGHLHMQGSVRDWTAVLAVEQSAGKGQKGRIWLSPPGNLYAAWHWPFLPEPLLPLAPYIIALGVSKALEHKGLNVLFKWPNDILVQGKKVSGILITQAGGESIVGVGINLTWAPEDRLMQIQGSPRATSLLEQGVSTDPLHLWMDVASRTQEVFGLSPEIILSSVEKRLAWIGQTVMIHNSNSDSAYKATLAGLAGDGALLIQRNRRRQRLYSASLAPIEDK